jgi:tetratricopeptide (TPR) repeat protein
MGMSTADADSRQSNNRFIYIVLGAIIVVNIVIIAIAQATQAPDPVTELARDAVLAHENGDYDLAIAGYSEALTLAAGDSDESARLHYNRGVSYWLNDDIDAATADFEQAIALDEAYYWPHLALGDIYSQQGNPEQALAAYRQFRDLSVAADDDHASNTATERIKVATTQQATMQQNAGPNATNDGNGQ